MLIIDTLAQILTPFLYIVIDKINSGTVLFDCLQVLAIKKESLFIL